MPPIKPCCEKDNVAVDPFADYEEVELFEYRDIWAEESGAMTNNSAEWSYGNGATGFIGLPIDAGWLVESMYFHADTYAARTRIEVALLNYGNTPSSAAANRLTSITLANAADGGGQTNNAYKMVNSNDVPIPVTGTHTVIGFHTVSLRGAASDGRVGARLRRSLGFFLRKK